MYSQMPSGGLMVGDRAETEGAKLQHTERGGNSQDLRDDDQGGGGVQRAFTVAHARRHDQHEKTNELK